MTLADATALSPAAIDVNAVLDSRPGIDVTHHVGLAYAVAPGYQRWAAAAGVSLEDLQGEAVLELVRLAKSGAVDPARGCFSTLAYHSIGTQLRKLLKRRRVLAASLTGEEGREFDVEDQHCGPLPLEDADLLEKLMADLPPRLRGILVRRYGLDKQGCRSMAALAAEEKVAVSRVQQLITSGLQKLRAAAEAMGLSC